MNSCDTENNCCGWTKPLSILAAILIFAALVVATKKYTQPEALGAARAAERSKALAELKAANADAFENVAWLDKDHGVVRLPIAEALKLAEAKGQNPAKARADLIARVEKATAKLPEKPSAFE